MDTFFLAGGISQPHTVSPGGMPIDPLEEREDWESPDYVEINPEMAAMPRPVRNAPLPYRYRSL